jgi:hypothetical protein
VKIVRRFLYDSFAKRRIVFPAFGMREVHFLDFDAVKRMRTIQDHHRHERQKLSPETVVDFVRLDFFRPPDALYAERRAERLRRIENRKAHVRIRAEIFDMLAFLVRDTIKTRATLVVGVRKRRRPRTTVRVHRRKVEVVIARDDVVKECVRIHTYRLRIIWKNATFKYFSLLHIRSFHDHHAVVGVGFFEREGDFSRIQIFIQVRHFSREFFRIVKNNRRIGRELRQDKEKILQIFALHRIDKDKIEKIVFQCGNDFFRISPDCADIFELTIRKMPDRFQMRVCGVFDGRNIVFVRGDFVHRRDKRERRISVRGADLEDMMRFFSR